MHHWNQDNFEGLKSIGEKYSSIKEYELFGQYCLQKEQGLKKLANASISEFVSSTERESIHKQREIAEELTSLSYENQHIHQLISHHFLIATLSGWEQDEPDNPTVFKLLGYMARDLSYFERALQIDPNDAVCIAEISRAYLDDIDHHTHHLSESLFIGELEDAKSALNAASSLVDRLAEGVFKCKMQEEILYYERLLHCWQTYSNGEFSDTFPDWCVTRGENFDFRVIVYYDKK